MTIATMSLWNIGYKEIVTHSIAEYEKGWVNNPKDPGKETMCGITIATATQYKDELVAKFKWTGKMRDLTQEMADYIYLNYWWKPLRCDDLREIHPFIAQRVFDFGINGGRGRAGESLQIVLNVLNRNATDYPDLVVDGGIGNKTIEALKAYANKRGASGLRGLLIGIASRHMVHYQTIAIANQTLETFSNGWQTRIEQDIAMYYRVYGNV